MNIFVLDRDPKTAARMLCDKHIVKMCVEASQMLNLARGKGKGFMNHPCSVWTRQSKSNYDWLCEHGLEICKEYTRRYGKFHKSQIAIQECIDNPPTLKDLPLTEFAQAMPDEYKDLDAVKAYRSYYLGEKLGFAKWKLDNIPLFVKEYINKQKINNFIIENKNGSKS